MLSKDTKIFASYHPNEETIVLFLMEQVQKAGWHNVDITGTKVDQSDALESIQQSGMVLIFLSKAFAQDERLMLEKFAYAATVVRKPFIPVWIDTLADIQQEYQNVECDKQLLSALEMLTAKHVGTTPEGLVAALEQYTPDNTPYKPSTPQICEKPCEAYEGDEPYIFISYAHDDATRVYPIIKELYEAGWDLWYDEGIKITERYLPVIAHHVKRCSVFVLMLTNRCLERPFVMNYELEYARQRGIPIITVLLDDLKPELWSKENAERLEKKAIKQNVLLESISTFRFLTKQGKRIAVPPAIKQNVVYDVVLPPELPEFEIVIQGDAITIAKYVGNDTEIIIPNSVTTPDGSITFQVISIGKAAFSGCVYLKSIILPEGLKNIGVYSFRSCFSLTNIIIPYGVTNIGDCAFFGCKSLTSITILGSNTEIGNMAFEGCISLKNDLTSNNIIHEFSDDFHLDSRKMEVISEIAMRLYGVMKCNDFRVLKDNNTNKPYFNAIPQSQETPRALICSTEEDLQLVNTLLIELYWEGFNFYYEESVEQCEIEEIYCVLAFFSENASKSTKIIDLLKRVIEKDASCIIQVFLNDCTEWPDEIKNNLQDRQAIFQSRCLEKEFTGNIRSSLRQFGCSLGHPRGFDVKNLGTSVEINKFNEMDFQHVIIPKTFFNPPLLVSSIGAGAFSGCASLISVSIPESVANIGNRSFSDCHSMINISIAEGLICIGNEAFEDCVSLTSIIIPDSVTSIGNSAFSNCESLTNIRIPDGIISINERVFSGCKSLTSVIISNNVTNIGNYAFEKCESLTEIKIPDGLICINERTFSGCKLLTNIIVPEGVTSIGDRAFYGCQSLKNITIPGSVTSIGKGAFGECTSLTIHTLPGNKVWNNEEIFEKYIPNENDILIDK